MSTKNRSRNNFSSMFVGLGKEGEPAKHMKKELPVSVRPRETGLKRRCFKESITV